MVLRLEMSKSPPLQKRKPLNFNEFGILMGSEEPYKPEDVRKTTQAQRAFNGTVC